MAQNKHRNSVTVGVQKHEPVDSTGVIRLRGVRVHNLQAVDLDLPIGKLVVIAGVSGAGKSSLAFDTLYAEGQRRYIEGFSSYSRQFLERLEPPTAEEIGPMPPAIAVRQWGLPISRRSTLGSLAEVLDHLQVLYARAGTIVCPDCQTVVSSHSPASILAALEHLPPGTSVQVCFPLDETTSDPETASEGAASSLQQRGFTRVIAGRLSLAGREDAGDTAGAAQRLVVVDRIVLGATSEARAADSIETAFREGQGCCVILAALAADQPSDKRARGARSIVIDGRTWMWSRYFERLLCPGCRREFTAPEPPLFSFHSARGACPRCHGLGVVKDDRPEGESRSPELTFPLESFAVCPACQGARLCPDALAVRVAGKNLAELCALSVDEASSTLHDWQATLPANGGEFVGQILPSILARLSSMKEVGLSYLALDRISNTLSRGELQRARLAAALGTGLQGVLYVFDEPAAGLHAAEIESLLRALVRLRDAGNTLVVVEHHPMVAKAADWIVELGPQSGSDGGRIIFQGTFREMLDAPDSVLGACLRRHDPTTGTRMVRKSDPDNVAAVWRQPTAWLQLSGVQHRNLHDLSVQFPLGVLCVVTGVSGSGKSSLVHEVLFPAVAASLRARPGPCVDSNSDDISTASARCEQQPGLAGARYECLQGAEALDEVVFLNQTPLGRSVRTLSGSTLGILAEVRGLFAATAEAKARNFTARHFSLAVADGGRCAVCAGLGELAVDMQFLPDVVTPCPDCRGRRFRSDVLDIKYRGLSIAEVLDLSVQDGFAFFRGRSRIQRRLKVLKDVGLGYLKVGQPCRRLAGGEAQRLRLAAILSRRLRKRTLFLLDEPTVGLHPQNVAGLLMCWQNLLAEGHSVIAIEHNLDVIRAADHVIDLGPGAGARGGRVVATGTPEQVAANPASVTGSSLGKLTD